MVLRTNAIGAQGRFNTVKKKYIGPMKKNIKTLGVIPARYKSSRFEGKPLVKISGVPMIKRTFDQVKNSKYLDDLLVATEDERIFKYCESQNIPAEMTSDNCSTGTDRVSEIAEKRNYDFYINIQGDEPVIDPSVIDQLIDSFITNGDKYSAYNLYKSVTDKTLIESENIVKVIVSELDELIYMSRLPIPYSKAGPDPNHFQQVCSYGYTPKALALFRSHGKTINERFEDIELLRFIDLGFKVKMIRTTADSVAVDIPADISKVEKFLEENKRRI